MRAVVIAKPDLPTLSKAQIGRCGEILVQYRLLKNGIESASMTSPAQIVALVDLSTERVWLFQKHEFKAAAQQQSRSGNHKFFVYTDREARPKKGRRSMDTDFQEHLLTEFRIKAILDSNARSGSQNFEAPGSQVRMN